MLGQSIIKNLNANSTIQLFYNYILKTYDISSTSEPLGFQDQTNSS